MLLDSLLLDFVTQCITFVKGVKTYYGKWRSDVKYDVKYVTCKLRLKILAYFHCDSLSLSISLCHVSRATSRNIALNYIQRQIVNSGAYSYTSKIPSRMREHRKTAFPISTIFHRNKSFGISPLVLRSHYSPGHPAGPNELYREETRGRADWLSSAIYKLVSALTWIMDHLLPLFRPIPTWFRLT